MDPTEQHCANCKKTGLPILPVRYTVLPKTVTAKLPGGISGTGVTNIELHEHHYGLRALREGWLYLFYVKGARGSNYWEAYKVTQDGRLWKQTLPLTTTPTIHPACAQKSIAVPMDLIAIEQPEKCTGRVYIAFSEITWHSDIFKQYADNETLRNKRMQWIEPARWITGSKDENGHAVIATEASIDDVVEYMPGLDPKLLEPQRLLEPKNAALSDESGNYKEEWVKKEATRYPLHVRQATPASASGSLVKLMNSVGETEDGKPQPPMLLALWDGIGNAHELNGFRNDPASWFDQYVTERALQVTAMHNIDTAHKIVQSRQEQALNDQESMARQAHEMTPLGRPEAQTALAAQRARALAGADAARATQINAYYDDMNWMAANNIPGSYQTQLIQMGRMSSAGSASSSAPYTGAYRDDVMNKARAYAQARPGFHDRNVKDSTKRAWSVYEARLKRDDIETFRKKYEDLQSTVYQLQETRSDDVGKWVNAPLLITALEDCHPADMHDALVFETVVSDAVVGLASTPKGKTVVDGLLTQWDPTQPGSLIWRVVAMNQMDARQELGQALKAAQAHKATSLETGFETFASIAASTKKLVGYYKSLAQTALETDPKKITPLAGLLQRLGADQFGMSVGDAIFAKFRVNQIGDFVGEKFIQSILLQRAGVPYEDAIALVRKQAELEKISRLDTIKRLLVARAALRSAAPEGASKATKELYETWDKVKLADEGKKPLLMGRIAVVSALLETVNFVHLLAGAQDKDTRLKLIQSGASLCSSLITISMTPYYAVLKNSVRSQSWKLVGGALGSVGTMISAWLDVEKAGEGRDKGQYDTATVLYVKFGLGTLAGTAMLIDAVSTAAPLLKKLAARYGSEVVMGAVETITERVAIVAGLRAVGMLIGWEATIGLLLLQALADWLTPDALEAWCSRCAFGTGRETILRVTDHSVARSTDAAQQDKDFTDAMAR
ncbi:T6SS effector BTH_I2691 family protein [Paraburkholderia caffeinilytica]|uniref:T6SS effector BTH_I2691 family protein n=1 Tax=Paraburkholderia caffeinilytica TaxID=1761016 RepID=UPI0038B9CDA1